MIHPIYYICVGATLINMILAIADGNYFAAAGWLASFCFGMSWIGAVLRNGEGR